jgi:hypothetical protein
MQDKKFWNDWFMVIMASLTLGLAPFVPEPHIWGKIRWVAGGANGMSLMDWGDFFMHGIPWILLIRLIVIKSWVSIKLTQAQK